MMSPDFPRRDALSDDIARQEVRLAGLAQEQERSKARLDALKAELASYGAEPAVRVQGPQRCVPSWLTAKGARPWRTTGVKFQGERNSSDHVASPHRIRTIQVNAPG